MLVQLWRCLGRLTYTRHARCSGRCAKANSAHSLVTQNTHPCLIQKHIPAQRTLLPAELASVRLCVNSECKKLILYKPHNQAGCFDWIKYFGFIRHFTVNESFYLFWIRRTKILQLIIIGNSKVYLLVAYTGLSLFSVCVCVFVSVSLASVLWIATVGSSFFQCWKPKSSTVCVYVCEVEEKGGFVSHHIHPVLPTLLFSLEPHIVLLTLSYIFQAFLSPSQPQVN